VGMDLMLVKSGAMQDGRKLTGIRLHITSAMVRSFVLLTRDGNGCQVFCAIGWRTLPHKNSFIFFSYSVMKKPFLFSHLFFVTFFRLKTVHSLMAACTFPLFLLIFIATLLGINTVLCSYGINN
jgi:hypothetical protein